MDSKLPTVYLHRLDKSSFPYLLSDLPTLSTSVAMMIDIYNSKKKRKKSISPMALVGIIPVNAPIDDEGKKRKEKGKRKEKNRDDISGAPLLSSPSKASSFQA